jgi:hypothetical protein
MVDALVIVRLLRTRDTLDAVAQECHRLRFRFAKRVQRASRRTGWLARQNSPFIRLLADRALRSMAALPRLTHSQRLLTVGWNRAEDEYFSPL